MDRLSSKEQKRKTFKMVAFVCLVLKQKQYSCCPKSPSHAAAGTKRKGEREERKKKRKKQKEKIMKEKNEGE
jgi:hypothetical protein